ncbi:hypothetical protein [Acidovorax sp.]|uniref:hypothetical protein n=1 Tax=Acidovorax sp. TaxID=1872122 RepID=UPI0031D5A442
MTPEQVQSLAHQASTYACQALLSNERWQEVRDQKFAELVTRDALEEAAKLVQDGEPPPLGEKLRHVEIGKGARDAYAAAIRKLKEDIQ